MSSFRASICRLAALALVTGCAGAQVELPAILGSHMVFQERSEARLWGKARPTEHITVSASWGEETVVRAAADGTWSAVLPTPAGSAKPHAVTIKASNTIVLEDVLIGQVWLCSGQSNMEWSVGPAVGPGVEDYEKELASAEDFPLIRLFDVPNAASPSPAFTSGGAWAKPSRGTLQPFSAIGWFFGKRLHAELGVPIGLIGSNWGGTPAESWTSRDGLSEFPEFHGALAALDPQRTKDLPDPPTLHAAWVAHLDESDPSTITERVFSRTFDDSAWPEIPVPGAWAGDLEKFDGIVWMRKTVDLPSTFGGRDLVLELPSVDDNDAAWFNGTKIGETTGADDWAAPRAYAIPGRLVAAGKNVIALRVLDTSGSGGIVGAADRVRLRLRDDAAATVSLAGPWKARRGAAAAALPKRPQRNSVGPWTPTALFNGMIAPLTGLDIRGTIWYQGEANVSRAHQYRRLFPALILDWRQRFHRGSDDAFYFVQIAPYDYDQDAGQAAELREAQTLTQGLPHTGMAVTMDIGNPKNIHPGEKWKVAERLALWALAKTYGRTSDDPMGPTLKEARAEGRSMRLVFDHTGGALKTLDGKPPGPFTMAGADRIFHAATALIDGDAIVLSAEKVERPEAVRHAWRAGDPTNLVNARGLPSTSFRTDDWPMLTAPAPNAATPTQTIEPRLPEGSPRRLVLGAPIARWDEGSPLGNGLTGGLLWGEGNVLKLSLNRGDLWDERPAPGTTDPDWNYARVQALVEAKNWKELVDRFDRPYDEILHPTKLPPARIEFRFDAAATLEWIALDLSQAEALARFTTGDVRAFFAADRPVAMFRLQGLGASDIAVLRPHGLDRLGYEKAVFGKDGETSWMVQRAADDLVYAVVVSSRRDGASTEVAVAVAATTDGPDPLALAKARAAAALGQGGYYAAFSTHVAWWRSFWDTSDIRIPDARAQAHYDLVKYFIGSASRPGAPPMPLQGVWTADEGGLPPWKGDYHHDLNTETTYQPCAAAGLFDSGESFLSWNESLASAYARFGRSFFDCASAVPGVSTLSGRPLGGWGQYSLSPTMGLWVAQLFHRQWRYTMKESDRIRALRFLDQALAAPSRWWKKNSDGKLRLPLSTSPEIHDNSPAAWLPPNSNFDQSLILWALGALNEMNRHAPKGGFMVRPPAGLADFEPLDTEGPGGALTFARGMPFRESHRHFSHAMAVHPLGIVNIDGQDDEARTVQATIDATLAPGTRGWVGYSFTWMAAMLARAGRPEQALDYLDRYLRGFILRNGFHANGDQSGTGMSGFTYRPFTLEGNALAMEAIQEMLLQSWGRKLRVFPAASVRWRNASFRDLRAEGGFVVSAERVDGRTTKVAITATRDGRLVLADPFPGRRAAWSEKAMTISAFGDIEVFMVKGQTLVGSAD